MDVHSLFLLLVVISHFGGLPASGAMFRTEPRNVTSVRGETGGLGCQAQTPSPPAQWVKDGLLLGFGATMPSFPRYRVTGDPSAGEFNLRIERVELADEGGFQCQVGRSTFGPGIISGTAWLTVLVPPGMPEFQGQESGSVPACNAGAECWVTCRAPDAKPPAHITIHIGDQEMPASDTSVTPGSSEKLFTTESTVRFIAESSDHGKEITCSAMNTALTRPLLANFTLNVLYPPQRPKVGGYDGRPVRAGEVLRLTCIADGGNPLADLRWLKGTSVVSRAWGTEEGGSRTRSDLTLHVAAQDNGATLSCEAETAVTRGPITANVTLHVVFPPDRVEMRGETLVNEGTEVRVSCETSSSNPRARHHWWLLGGVLNQTSVTHVQDVHGGMSTVSNVSFIADRSMDKAGLVCGAVNEASFSTLTADKTLIVQYPPDRIWIQGPLETVSFPIDALVILTCFCGSGSPIAKLHWTKDDVSLNQGVLYKTLGKIAVSELEIVTDPSDNQASYACHASHPARVDTLAAHTRLTVHFAPMGLEIEALGGPVRAGETVSLVCAANSSNPASDIAWVWRGKVVPALSVRVTRGEFVGWSTQSRLSFSVSPGDHGQTVRCRSSTPGVQHKTNTALTLDVLHSPQFLVEQLSGVEGVEGGSVLLPLHLSAFPAPLSFTWSHGGTHLVTDGPTRHHLRPDGSLEIWNLTRYDQGAYKVIVRNAEGANETFLTLTILYSPRISSLTNPANVEIGGTAEMVCAVLANPVLRGMVRWNYMGEGREVNEDNQIFMGNSTKLVIVGASRSDAGRYECVADNGIPPTLTTSAQLIVEFEPQLHGGVDLAKVAATGDGTSPATLTCKAEGIPDVEFSWARNGVTLDPGNPRFAQSIVHEGALHTASLTIANASARLDFATYTCTARNRRGVDTTDVRLVRIGKPDPPSDLSLVRKSQNSITLAWNPGFNGGLEQSFRIRYAAQGSPATLHAEVYPPHATIFTVTGLHPGTTYNLSVSAHNPLGSSETLGESRTLSVTTSGHPAFPTGSPHELEAGPLSLPLPILIPVSTLILSLLLLNIGILAGIVWKMRAARQTEIKARESKSFQGFELNEYADNTRDANPRKPSHANPQRSVASSESYRNYSAYRFERGRSDREFSPADPTQPRDFRNAGLADYDAAVHDRSTDSRSLPLDEGIYEDVEENSSFESFGRDRELYYGPGDLFSNRGHLV